MSCSGERHPLRGFDMVNDSLFSLETEDTRDKYQRCGDKHKISKDKDSLTDSPLRIWSLL